MNLVFFVHVDRVYIEYLRRNKSWFQDFDLIFLFSNTWAHFQHNYNNSDRIRRHLDSYLAKTFRELRSISKDLEIITALSQKKPERPVPIFSFLDYKKFASLIIDDVVLLPGMTHEILFRAKNEHDCETIVEKLKSFKNSNSGEDLFYVEKVTSKNCFCQINFDAVDLNLSFNSEVCNGRQSELFRFYSDRTGIHQPLGFWLSTSSDMSRSPKSVKNEHLLATIVEAEF